MLPAFEYAEAATVEDALNLAAASPSMFLAGGQGLLSEMARGVRRPVQLVDVSRIPELATVREDDRSVVTGALVRLNEVAGRPVPVALSLLAHAAARVGSPPIRTRATIGGNLCYGLGTSEVTLAALATGAEVTIAELSGTQRLLAGDDLASMRPTNDRSPYLVLSVRWPAPPTSTSVGVDVAELGEQHDWLPAIALATVVHRVDGTPAHAATAIGYRSGRKALIVLDEPNANGRTDQRIEAALRPLLNGDSSFSASWVAERVAESIKRALAQCGGEQ